VKSRRLRGQGPWRWLLLATHVGPDGAGGGMSRYAVELARALDGHAEVDAHVLVKPASRSFFVELLGDPERVHAVPSSSTMVVSMLERTGLATGRGFDVVQGTKHLVPRWGSAVRVLTVHDMLMLDRPEDHSARKRLLLRRPYLGSIRSADVLVCISHATRERLGAYDPAAAERSDVVPSAVSTALLDASPRPIPALESRRFAVVVGDPSPRKNLRLLVDLWREVVAVVPDATLAIVGPAGWGIADYGEDHERLRRAGSLETLGHVDDGQLRWCYENAALVLCPSLQEGFGLPVIEALAFGAGVLASDDPALREVSDGRATHLPADDGPAWVRAIVEGFGRSDATRAEPRDVRTWSRVADETVAAVRRRAAATASDSATRLRH
jgi:glycosyltransferase involved in cell wall biosynthesis